MREQTELERAALERIAYALKYWDHNAGERQLTDVGWEAPGEPIDPMKFGRAMWELAVLYDNLMEGMASGEE